ncbi:MAG: hypothetical protein K2L91_06520 [Duncaniella sp.]|nr:hypothetical protein [Duncaniella sp.]MDE6466448.1 hypothetical protein [Duncaniella sp.]
MKTRHIIFTTVIASALSSCNGNPEKEQQSLLEISKHELVTALGERDQLLSLVKEVSEGLEQIKQLENMMSVASSLPNENTRRQAMILTDIASLKERIQQRKAKLRELEERLHNSTINNKELKETIEALRMQMDSQIEETESLRKQLIAANEHIGLLNSTVDSLNTTVYTVTDERNAAQENSTRLENELNTCYYVIASKSDLKKHNIIESGFLRKTKLMKGDFDKGCFVTGDKRTLTTLPLGTDKARILSNHPGSSYRMVDENNGKAIIITNPDEFWSLTNYLVIQKN